MDEWIDYYNSTHTIYASKLHRDLHFKLIARDIIGYISSPDAVVLDYACGEALFAANVADACGKLYLAEPAPGVRGRLIARFAPNTKIRVRSLDDVRKMAENSLDLVVMNSVAQYMTPEELDSAFAVIRRLLKPSGRLVLGDILRPEVGMVRDVRRTVDDSRQATASCTTRCSGSLSTALSDYRQLRTRIGLQRYSEDEMIEKLAAAGFTATRAPGQYRAQSVADDLCGAAARSTAPAAVRVNQRVNMAGPRRDSAMIANGPVAESVDAGAVQRSLSWFKSRPGLQPSLLRS